MARIIINDSLKHRFQTEAGTQTAFLAYRIAEDRITFTHTEVPPALEGRGIGTSLAKAGVAYAQDHGLRIVAQCPFIADFIQTHPQYKHLLAG